MLRYLVILLGMSSALWVVLLLLDLRGNCPCCNSSTMQQQLQLRGYGGSGVHAEHGVADSDPGSLEAYRSAALKNITDFKAQLLSTTIGSFGPFNESEWLKFSPIISCPPNRPLTKYGGNDDGSKLLCNLHSGPHQLRDEGCVIYSMGSNGQYQFEDAMLEETDCEIHTFDCTYNGRSRNWGRHKYHKWCIGSSLNNPGFKSWAEVTRKLGHAHVDLLKIDIEGHEYPVLAEFKPGDALPGEISMELHVRAFMADRVPNSAGGLGLVFMHLANLGYGAYAQEVNVYAKGCCSEFSFLRIV